MVAEEGIIEYYKADYSFSSLQFPERPTNFVQYSLVVIVFLNIVVVPVYKFQITIINLWLPGLGAVAAATGVAESLGALPLFFAPGGAMATHRKGAISLVQHEFCSYSVYWPMGNRRLFAYFKISKYGSRRFMNRPAASPPACGPVRINGK